MVEVRFKLEQGIEAAFDAANLRESENDGLKVLDEQIMMVQNLSVDLHKEMSDLRQTSNKEQSISSSTTTKVVLFGVLSVGIIAVSAVVQILYLRRFFRDKKIM